MTLYYSTGACSLSPRIVAEELGLKLNFVRVDLRTKLTEASEDYTKIVKKGAVPALALDNGEILTEGAAIVQYLCDQVPGQKLLPATGTMERYRVLEWLNYIASEVHKGYSPLFSASRVYSDEAVRAVVLEKARAQLFGRLGYIEETLKGPFLMGAAFTPADSYLFNVLSWSKMVGVELASFPRLMGFWEAVNTRPAVQRAKSAEGLK